MGTRAEMEEMFLQTRKCCSFTNEKALWLLDRKVCRMTSVSWHQTYLLYTSPAHSNNGVRSRRYKVVSQKIATQDSN